MGEQVDRLLLMIAVLLFFVAAVLPFAAVNWSRWVLFALVMTASVLGVVGAFRGHRRVCALLDAVREGEEDPT
jgi:hypothetical protein